jgi:hypothetical protein
MKPAWEVSIKEGFENNNNNKKKINNNNFFLYKKNIATINEDGVVMIIEVVDIINYIFLSFH